MRRREAPVAGSPARRGFSGVGGIPPGGGRCGARNRLPRLEEIVYHPAVLFRSVASQNQKDALIRVRE